MATPIDSTHQKLSMTKDNRHQYFETAMVSSAEAEREILQAEARGRERRVREALFKRKLQNIALVAVGVLVLAALALLVISARG